MMINMRKKLDISNRFRFKDGWIVLSDWSCPNCGKELQSSGGNSEFVCRNCGYCISNDFDGSWSVKREGKKLKDD